MTPRDAMLQHRAAVLQHVVLQVNECSMDLSAWQQRGEDRNSTVATMPDDQTLIGWARATLGF